MKKNIFLVGYTANNLGDDLFIRILLERYSKTKFTIVADRKYEKKMNRKNLNVLNDKLYKINEYINKYIIHSKHSYFDILASKYDATVIIGGSMYIEPTGAFVNNCLYEKKPYYILGINFGPYKTNRYYFKALDFFKSAEDVCFRDKNSYELFSSLSNVRLAPDIVFSLSLPSVEEKNELFISVMNFKNKENLARFHDNYITTIINYIKENINNFDVINLVSFCKKEGDEEGIKEILESLSSYEIGKVKSLYYKNNIDELLVAVAKSSVILATRFHSIVLGLSAGKRVIPICYNNKSQNLLVDLGFKDYIVTLNNLNIVKLREISLKPNDLQNLKNEAEKHFDALDRYIMNLED